MPARLMIKNIATEQEFEYPLLANEIRIGRSPEDNELVLNNEKVSRRHAALRRSGKTYTVTDLQSANHTMVNEKVVTEQEVFYQGTRNSLAYLPPKIRMIAIEVDDHFVVNEFCYSPGSLPVKA